jgi:hypothetical protein
MIVSWKKPDQLFMEVRAKKLAELQEYKATSQEQKVKDIMSLLQKMKGGKGEKLEGD